MSDFKHTGKQILLRAFPERDRNVACRKSQHPAFGRTPGLYCVGKFSTRLPAAFPTWRVFDSLPDQCWQRL